MTKKSSPKELRAVSSAVADLTFIPTNHMMRTKALFYANWVGISQATQADAVEITRDTRLKEWWARPGFKEWFMNADTVRAQLMYLKDLALQTAEQILSDPDANAAAKVNMIKNILIYNEALEQKAVERASLKINRMSNEDIQRKLKEVIDVEGE